MPVSRALQTNRETVMDMMNVRTTGCSKSFTSKAAASEEVRRTLRYVEPLSNPRTPLVDFFNSLLRPVLRRLHIAEQQIPSG